MLVLLQLVEKVVFDKLADCREMYKMTFSLSACGTPSGQKKVKTILKSHKVRHFVRFSVKIKLDNYLFFIVVKSVLLLLCVYRQSDGEFFAKPSIFFYIFMSAQTP